MVCVFKNRQSGTVGVAKAPVTVRLHDKTEVEVEVEVKVEVQRVDSGGECYWLLVFGYWFLVIGYWLTSQGANS